MPSPRMKKESDTLKALKTISVWRKEGGVRVERDQNGQKSRVCKLG